MSRQKATPPSDTGLNIEVDFLDPLRNFNSPGQAKPKSKAGAKSRPALVHVSAEKAEAEANAGSGPSDSIGNGMTEMVSGETREKVDVAQKIGEFEPPSSAEGRATGANSARTLRIEYYDALLPEVESEVAFAAYYLGANLMASAEDFNQKFKNYSDANRIGRNHDSGQCPTMSFYSVERFIELGIIVGNLGALSLFPIPESMREADERDYLVLPEYLMLGGLGEPGSLTRDDVRFVMTNVVYAMKSIQKIRLSTHLIGIHSRSLNIRQSMRAIVEGIKEGMERFDVPEFVLRVVFDSRQFPFGASQIKFAIAHLASTFGNEIRIVADKICHHSDYTEIDLAHSAGNWEDGQKGDDAETDDEDTNESNFTRLTVTLDHAEDAAWTPAKSDPSVKSLSSRWKDLKYSALTSNSAIPTRTVRIQNSFAELLPNTVLDVCSFQDQWEYGNLMMHCFIPDDFQKLIEEGDKLTLVVDRETARIPWEMSGYSSKNSHKFFGTDLEISRQFRSTIGTASAHFPELNNELKILLIADPVSDADYALEGAVEEGFALAELFAEAQEAYGDRLDVRVHVRIGNERRGGDTYRQEMKERFAAAKRRFRSPSHADFQFCRPIEILKLLVHERFDIVHFAGHGKFVSETGEMGWMLDSDCTLTAKEIFRVRQVPRLVFANACRSGNVKEAKDATSGSGDGTEEISREHPEEVLERIYAEISLYGTDMRQKALFAHMSMAEAFFARGIPNFLGTGWNVHDEQASEFSLAFYRELIGLTSDGTVDGGKCIGEALKIARNSISPKKGLLYEIFGDASEIEEEHESSRESLDHAHSYHNTWGAYQHYGLPTDRLFVQRNGVPKK